MRQASRRGSRAVQRVSFWNGQECPDTGPPAGGAASGRMSASRPLRNRVWPYSLNRQQRPLATHTGPAAATSRSASWYNSSTRRRRGSGIISWHRSELQGNVLDPVQYVGRVERPGQQFEVVDAPAEGG